MRKKYAMRSREVKKSENHTICVILQAIRENNVHVT